MLQRLCCRTVITRRLQILHALFNVLPHADPLGIHHSKPIAFIGGIFAFFQKCLSTHRILPAAVSQ